MRKITGSVRERNGKWYYRIVYFDEYGQRKDIERRGGRTKTETNRMLANKIADLEEGTNFDVIKFKDLYTAFIAEKEKKGLKQTSINRYNSLYKKYLAVLDDLYITDIKQRHILQVYSSDEIGSTTKQVIFDLMKIIYKFAYMLGYVNSMAVIDRLERPQRDKTKIKNMELSDFQKIFSYLENNKSDYKVWLLYAFVMLDCELGCRRGELCGLTWDCIDFQGKYIKIINNLVYDNGKTYITTPKTDTAYRILYLSDKAVDLLKNMWSVTSENRLIMAGDYKELCYGGYNLIFRWQDGTPVHPDWFSKQFKKVQQKIGFTDFFRIHDIRHFNASVLVSSGIDIKTIQQRLGHADPSTTLKIYAHSFEVKQKEAVKAVEDFLNLQNN